MRVSESNFKAMRTLASQLTTIPGCPRSDEAIDGLAADLVKYCDDPPEAKWLVGEARTWEDWHGTHGLLDLLTKRRHPAEQVFDMEKRYGPKPKPECVRCDDWGYVSMGDGRARLCDCAAGKSRSAISLVDLMNRHQAAGLAQILQHPPQTEKRGLITQLDIDAEVAKRRAK